MLTQASLSARGASGTTKTSLEPAGSGMPAGSEMSQTLQ